jgi:uncharacterized membrane protein
MFVLIFNMILSPCLSTLLSDSACLYPLFHRILIPTPPIEITECVSFYVSDGSCAQYATIPKQLPASISPFIYNYGCASAMIQDFVPVFLYSAVFSGVLWPMLQICVVVMDEAGCIYHDYRPQICLVFPLLIVEHSSPSSELLDFELANTMVHLLVNLLILLTFGLACPYLGVAMVLSFVMRADVFIFLARRYVFRSSSPSRSLSEASSSDDISISESFRHSSRSLELSELLIPPNLLDQQESTDLDLPPPLSSLLIFNLKSAVSVSLLMFSLWIGLFWSFESFDMVGDVYGSEQGMWASVCAIVFLLVSGVLLLQYKLEDEPNQIINIMEDKTAQSQK